jgi:hypothetical protein
VKGPGLGGGGVDTELIGERGREDGVGELLLLAAGLAAGIGVDLVLAVVAAVEFAGGEDEPAPYVGDPGGPPGVDAGVVGTALETVKECFDLE